MSFSPSVLFSSFHKWISSMFRVPGTHNVRAPCFQTSPPLGFGAPTSSGILDNESKSRTRVAGFSTKSLRTISYRWRGRTVPVLIPSFVTNSSKTNLRSASYPLSPAPATAFALRRCRLLNRTINLRPKFDWGSSRGLAGDNLSIKVSIAPGQRRSSFRP